VFAGAFPTAYGAVKLASEQKPLENCEQCATTRPRFYLFNEKTHELIAGPEFTEEDLYITATGHKRAHKGEVVEVPVGTAVVAEPAKNSRGEVIEGAEPGWFAIVDKPALSGTEITNPEAKSGEFGEPIVVFEFTGKGQEEFHDVTRQIAQRGQAQAIGLP